MPATLKDVQINSLEGFVGRGGVFGKDETKLPTFVGLELKVLQCFIGYMLKKVAAKTPIRIPIASFCNGMRAQILFHVLNGTDRPNILRNERFQAGARNPRSGISRRRQPTVFVHDGRYPEKLECHGTDFISIELLQSDGTEENSQQARGTIFLAVVLDSLVKSWEELWIAMTAFDVERRNFETL